MTGDVTDLRNARDTTLYVHVIDDNGEVQKIAVTRLRPGDLGDATEYVYELRSGRAARAATNTNLALEQVRDMHSRTLAQIQCTNISAYDIVCDPMGRIKLCQLALSRAGEKMTVEQTKAKLAHVDLDEFFFTLCALSGIYKATDQAGPEAADPLGTRGATPTGKPSEPSRGADESPASATATE